MPRWLTFVALAVLALFGCSRPALWLLGAERPPVSDAAADAGRDTGTDGPVADATADTGPPAVTPDVEAVSWRTGFNRKLDLLYVVDNGPGMEKAQENLRLNLPRFFDVLKSLPDGLPDLHIAVVSSDLGAGSGGVPGCSAVGDRGAFQFAPGKGSGCKVTGLDAGARFINYEAGRQPKTNFGNNDITTVLQCLLPLGAQGCPFGRPLAAAARALGADGSPAPPDNAGFLRDDAQLAIVIVTNRDDCSAADERFYTTADNAIASALGPATHYRCNEFGHLCAKTAAGALTPPVRKAPSSMIGDVVNYESCVPAEAVGRLKPVAELATGIKLLKLDPAASILVTTVQGPSVPYAVHWVMPPVGGEPPWPEVDHACSGSDGSFADPGIRLQRFSELFGASGLASSICEDNFGPALQTIATRFSVLLTPGCLTGTLWDTDGNPANGVQYDCTADDVLPSAEPGGPPLVTHLPRCDGSTSVIPCWSMRPLPTNQAVGFCAGATQAFGVTRSTASTPNELRTEVRCKVCPPGQHDPAHGCP